ncbi:MAG: hypothetical protein ACR2FE_00890 [Aeromicrobium sp.]
MVATDRMLAPGCGAHAVLAEPDRFGLTWSGASFGAADVEDLGVLADGLDEERGDLGSADQVLED